MKKWIKILLVIFTFTISVTFIILILFIAHWYFRQNTSKVNPGLEINIWTVASEGNHCFITDLLSTNEYFYLIYQSSPTHFFSKRSKLILQRSKDCKNWEKISEFKKEEYELRDPKLIEIHDSLFLYALKNNAYDPEPYQTLVASSKDGVYWTDFTEIDPKGYLFWKPKTIDNRTWYNTAYWYEHGQSILIKSIDGRNWERISDIHKGDTNDETALEILSDGKIIITARLEADPAWHSGSQFASTLIAYSFSPYSKWHKVNSFLARLDGAAMFRIEDKIFAVGRYDPEGRNRLFGNSSIFSKKRTAIYLISDDGLKLVTELPSCGDTSYPGVAEKDGNIYISYYTNDIKKDYPWIMGMFLPTEIKIVKIRSDELYSIL